MKPLAEFVKDDYFKIDTECHMAPTVSHLKYFFEYEKEGKAYGLTRILGMERPDTPPTPPLSERESTAEWTIAIMDKYGIDMACATREDIRRLSGGVAPITTSQYIIDACERYPDRLIFQANPEPLVNRDMKHILWEVEYLVKEQNCKIVGEIAPMGGTYINDRALWPFYAKISELGVPINIHTGMNWVQGGHSDYCHPRLLEDVVEAFPRLNIIALHCAWPYHHELFMIASTHSNLYVSLSLLCPWCITAPRRAAKIIGEALQFIGSDRVVWGTDNFGSEARARFAVQGFSQFQIPEDMQEGYGFPPLTDEDKHKIFGLNMAKLLGVEPKRRLKIKGDKDGK